MARAVIELVVGTYARLGGRGLVPLTYQAASDAWTLGDADPAIRDASYGVHAPAAGLYHFVEEANPGQVSCHLGPGEQWHRLASADSAGAAPCHLALAGDQSRLAAANYESGTVALWRLGPNGTPIDPPATYRLEGSGPNPERQEHSHAHWVGFGAGDRLLYCVDLGADRVVAFPLDPQDARLGPPVLAYQAPPGTGPRHLCFHPHEPLAFLISELASTLTVLRVQEDGGLAALQVASTLPESVPDNLGGAITLNRAGDRVYASNRGHDSIAVFTVTGGAAELVQHVPSGGASPRFILLLEDEQRLLVANEEGGTVGVFTVAADGTLSPDPLVIAVPGAVFLAEVAGAARLPG